MEEGRKKESQDGHDVGDAVVAVHEAIQPSATRRRRPPVEGRVGSCEEWKAGPRARSRCLIFCAFVAEGRKQAGRSDCHRSSGIACAHDPLHS